MAGRGATTFQKRQKEMQRKEKQQQKFAKKMERKNNPEAASDSDVDSELELLDREPQDETTPTNAL